MKETLSVPDVSCGHCKATVESALEPLDGVKDASVDITSRTVEVEYEPATVSKERLAAVLDEIGYPVAG